MKIRRLPVLHIEGYKEMSIQTGPKEFLNPKSVFLPLQFPGEMERLKADGERVKMGEAVMQLNSRFPYPVLSPISGVIKGVVKKWHPSNKLMDMLEIENDFKEESVDTYKGLKPEKLTRNELVDLMKNIGLVGMGGAGFPAYAKYSTDKPVDCVIINLAECEPFLTSDYTATLYNAQLFIYGLRYLIKAAGAPKGVIAIKNKSLNVKLIGMLEPLLDSNMEIGLLKDVYPAGWERYTVETITGKTYKMLPIEAGAIVSNATTCLTFARLLKEGLTPSMKYVTITGSALNAPGNVLCKIGTPLSDILPLFGGLKETSSPSNTTIVAGGPMTGKSMFFNDLVTTPTLGAVIYLENKHFGEKTPECLGCGRCTEKCPSFLSPFEIRRSQAIGDLEELEKLGAKKCIQCGLCSYVCPSKLDLTYSVGLAKTTLMKLGRR